jgi:hypothetical protein
MTEGEVYLCSWSRTRGGYRVWLTSDPSITAHHAEFDDADELLYEQIMAATGDGENLREYAPPPPATPVGEWERGRLWRLGAEGSAAMSHEPSYFEGGLCDNCLMPLGPRNAIPLEISALSGRGNAATVSLAGALFGAGAHLMIVSERLLDCFTDVERSAFEWRPVQGLPPRRAFFEPVPRSPFAPDVCPHGRARPSDRCEVCGFTWRACQREKGWPDYYVSEADLPQPSQTLLTVGRAGFTTLAVTDDRWRELVGQPGLKGIKGTAIAVIAPDRVGQPTKFVPRPREKRAW